MILHDIAEGCIDITWLIPANLVKYVTRMAQETANMFAEEQILTVMLEKRCIYPMETELASEPRPLETEPSLLQTKPRPLESELSPSQSEPHILETETTALKRKVCCLEFVRKIMIWSQNLVDAYSACERTSQRAWENENFKLNSYFAT